MSPQQSIGPYRVIAKLGEGGMGEVYRAADSRQPKWNHEGSELFYLTNSFRTVMAARIRTTGTSIESETPREVVSSDTGFGPGTLSSYDVAPDGRIIWLDTGDARFVPLTVISNWQAGLQK